jgi:hypothetical protein
LAATAAEIIAHRRWHCQHALGDSVFGEHSEHPDAEMRTDSAARGLVREPNLDTRKAEHDSHERDCPAGAR